MRLLPTALRAAALLSIAAQAVDGASAQTVPAAAPIAQPSAQPAAAGNVIPAGTTVLVEIVDTLKASTSKQSQLFRLRLAEPIVADGKTLVPAGADGGGEVIDAKGPGLGGRPAVLILAARYLVSNGVRIPLGHLRYGSTGKDTPAFRWRSRSQLVCPERWSAAAM